MAIDECHEALDELLALVVGQPSKRDVAAKVIVAVGIAARASERTLFRDFDRQIWTVSGENPSPRVDHVLRVHAVALHVGVHYEPVSRTQQPLLCCGADASGDLAAANRATAIACARLG